MAYRKRTTPKRRSRVAKRVIRRTRRVKKIRRNKRVSASRVFHVTESIDVNDISLSATAQNIITDCRLGDFPRIALMRQHFLEYKIRSFTTTYSPKQQAQFWTGPSPSLQSLSEPLKAITYSDVCNSTAPGTGTGGVASYNEAMNQQAARMHSLIKPFSRTVKGAVMQVNNTAVNDYVKRNTWMRLYDGVGSLTATTALANHQGIGCYLPALAAVATTPNANPAFTIVKTIRVSFRGKKQL